MCCRSLRDARAYRAWLTWSHKPDSMRHVLPSQQFFSLGRTSAFSGDLAAEGTLDAMLKVLGSRRGSQHWEHGAARPAGGLPCCVGWGLALAPRRAAAARIHMTHNWRIVRGPDCRLSNNETLRRIGCSHGFTRMQARSYSKELIWLRSFSEADVRVQLNLIFNLRDLGWAVYANCVCFCNVRNASCMPATPRSPAPAVAGWPAIASAGRLSALMARSLDAIAVTPHQSPSYPMTHTPVR